MDPLFHLLILNDMALVPPRVVVVGALRSLSDPDAFRQGLIDLFHYAVYTRVLPSSTQSLGQFVFDFKLSYGEVRLTAQQTFGTDVPFFVTDDGTGIVSLVVDTRVLLSAIHTHFDSEFKPF